MQLVMVVWSLGNHPRGTFVSVAPFFTRLCKLCTHRHTLSREIRLKERAKPRKRERERERKRRGYIIISFFFVGHLRLHHAVGLNEVWQVAGGGGGLFFCCFPNISSSIFFFFFFSIGTQLTVRGLGVIFSVSLTSCFPP